MKEAAAWTGFRVAHARPAGAIAASSWRWRVPKLRMALIHARPYQPQGNGKQERWFRTVRAQLLGNLTEAETASLESPNRRLWASVEAEYTTARIAAWRGSRRCTTGP